MQLAGSSSTQDEDLSKKKLCYERLGIEEYFLHDPFQDYLDPALQGYRLVKERYQRIRSESDGSLRSLTTGLLLRTEGKRLRLVDAATGEPLPWDEEWDAELDRERIARKALAAELERLRRESRIAE